MANQAVTAETILSNVVRMLEHAQRVPGMYMAHQTFQGATDFLGGVASTLLSLQALGVPGINPLNAQVKRARGYDVTAYSLSEFEAQVRARYSQEREVVAELIAIEIETCKRALELVRSAATA